VVRHPQDPEVASAVATLVAEASFRSTGEFINLPESDVASRKSKKYPIEYLHEYFHHI
jgi:hypothetical protein